MLVYDVPPPLELRVTMLNIFASDNVKYFHGTYIERISLKFSVSNMPGGFQKFTPVLACRKTKVRTSLRETS